MEDKKVIKPLFIYCPKSPLERNDYYISNLKLKPSNAFLIRFKSDYLSGIEKNDNVYCELFLPPDLKLADLSAVSSLPNKIKNKIKVIILLHGFSSKLNKLHNYYCFIDNALKNGYFCLFINLPFHLNRTPPGEKSGQRLIYSKEEQTLEFFHQAVVDIQKCISIVNHWLNNHWLNYNLTNYEQNKLKHESFNFSDNFYISPEYYICGISLGAMVSTITLAWDDRIKKGVLIQCGGNWDEIYWGSAVRLLMRGCFIDKEKISRIQAKKFYEPINDFLKLIKKINPKYLDSELEEYPQLSKFPQKKWFLSDPLTSAYKINPSNVLMINSKFDILFSKSSTYQLYEALGRPKIYWLNNFHTTMVFRQKKVQKLIIDFYND